MRRVQATAEQLEQILHEPVEDGYDPPALLDNDPGFALGQYVKVKVKDQVRCLILTHVAEPSDPFFTGTNGDGLFAFFASDILGAIASDEYQKANMNISSQRIDDILANHESV